MIIVSVTAHRIITTSNPIPRNNAELIAVFEEHRARRLVRRDPDSVDGYNRSRLGLDFELFSGKFHHCREGCILEG